MKITPLLLVLLVAACAPGPQEPTPLEPAAPTPMSETPTEPETPTEVEPLPEEPSVSVVPMEPEPPTEPPSEPDAAELPEVPTPTEAAPAEPDAPAAGEAAPANPAPAGTISISADNQTFVTSAEGELNPVTVPAGGTFYLRLEFSDPDGINAAEVQLRNSDAAGTLPTGPFSVAASDCEAQLASAPTELTCTLTVSVAPGTQNIAQPGETAYAFRPQVTDVLGNIDLAFSWAYLIVAP